ncbi:MAG: hypothetical protein U1G08_02505 [Verrucomicrobiota bacterium]
MLPRPDAPANPQADEVMAIATRHAARRQALVSPDDLRHACHVVALGKDRSSYDLTNWQMDRVVALFELLADNENISAQVRWANEDLDAVRRLEWAIKNVGFPEAYIAAISHGKFGSRAWKALRPDQLRQLLITLKGRAAARRHSPYMTAGTGTANGTAGRVEGAGGNGHGAHRPAGAGQPDARAAQPRGGSEL